MMAEGGGCRRWRWPVVVVVGGGGGGGDRRWWWLLVAVAVAFLSFGKFGRE